MRQQSSDPQARGARKPSLPRGAKPPCRTSREPNGSWLGTPSMRRNCFRERILVAWSSISSNSVRLILKRPHPTRRRKNSKTTGRRLPRGPRPHHLWSQIAPKKQEVGRASTFPAQAEQTSQAVVGTPRNPGLSPPRSPTLSLHPASTGPPSTLSKANTSLRHKRGIRGTQA